MNIKTNTKQGRSQDLVGGAKIIFFRFENLHVAKSCALLGRLGDMLSRKKF